MEVCMDYMELVKSFLALQLFNYTRDEALAVVLDVVDNDADEKLAREACREAYQERTDPFGEESWEHERPD